MCNNPISHKEALGIYKNTEHSQKAKWMPWVVEIVNSSWKKSTYVEKKTGPVMSKHRTAKG